MPYIKDEQRAKINYLIVGTVNGINYIESDVLKKPGIVNYVITRIVARSLKPKDGWSYHSLSRAIAVLRDAAAEMERRLMAPYEQGKRGENGDVMEYANPFPLVEPAPAVFEYEDENE